MTGSSLGPRSRVLALSVILLAGGGGPASAGGATATAESIIDRMIDQDPLGYGGAEARLVMALVNSRGQKQTRRMVLHSRKDGDTRRMFLRFLSPSDVSGTAFLGVDDDGDRTQYLYMPALAKTRRISSRQRNASFVGTDYSFADLDFRDVDDSAKVLLGSQTIAGQECWKVEVRPTSPESDYDLVHVWVAKKTHLPLRIRFYDGGGNETKRLTVQEVKHVSGRWIITESKMVDLKREHTTVMKVTEISLRDDISMDQFTVRALTRG